MDAKQEPLLSEKDAEAQPQDNPSPIDESKKRRYRCRLERPQSFRARLAMSCILIVAAYGLVQLMVHAAMWLVRMWWFAYLGCLFIDFFYMAGFIITPICLVLAAVMWFVGKIHLWPYVVGFGLGTSLALVIMHEPLIREDFTKGISHTLDVFVNFYRVVLFQDFSMTGGSGS
jgi:hypothetical protein